MLHLVPFADLTQAEREIIKNYKEKFRGLLISRDLSPKKFLAAMREFEHCPAVKAHIDTVVQRLRGQPKGSWVDQAAPHQIPPPMTMLGGEVSTWFLMGGRGSGKTRAGAEYVKNLALSFGSCWKDLPEDKPDPTPKSPKPAKDPIEIVKNMLKKRQMKQKDLPLFEHLRAMGLVEGEAPLPQGKALGAMPPLSPPSSPRPASPPPPTALRSALGSSNLLASGPPLSASQTPSFATERRDADAAPASAAPTPPPTALRSALGSSDSPTSSSLPHEGGRAARTTSPPPKNARESRKPPPPASCPESWPEIMAHIRKYSRISERTRQKMMRLNKKYEILPKDELINYINLERKSLDEDYVKRKLGVTPSFQSFYILRLSNIGQTMALMGSNYRDVDNIMIRGESGLLAVHTPQECPRSDPLWGSRPKEKSYIASRRLLVWRNGVTARVCSARSIDAIRGENFHFAWLDEIVKYKNPDEVLKLVDCTLRKSDGKKIITSTPSTSPFFHELVRSPMVTVTHATTFDNLDHLGDDYMKRVTDSCEDERHYQQEYEAVLMDESETSFWTAAQLTGCRVPEQTINQVQFTEVVVGVDPPATSNKGSASCGIVIAGKTLDGMLYILADETVSEAKPEVWAAKVDEVYRWYNAKKVIVEVNQGGDMVKAVLMQQNPSLRVVEERSILPKVARASEVSMIYKNGRVKHMGKMDQLEREMRNFTSDGLSLGKSPDRLDALVFALRHLCKRAEVQPRAYFL